MRTDDLGKTWTAPTLPPEVDWVVQPDGGMISVKDVTPGWHAPTKKLLAIGVKVRYGKTGEHLYDQPRSQEAAYALYDPQTKKWTPWKMLEMHDTENKFYLVAPGCVQWLVKPDGTILLPIYYRGPKSEVEETTVLHCSFDGTTLRYLKHGNEMALNVDRGLCEASITFFHEKYYLTIRNDRKGYVTTSTDGLHYEPIKAWTFDDGADLGSYNTQQHWITHSDGLFLVYTRRGANNDNVYRHRAPLFIARVDPDKLQVVRKSERILLPEHGATFGNGGAAAMTPTESWVIESEGLWDKAARRLDREGRVFLARIKWNKPNRLVVDAKP
jgi:hypothetical protein